jgi:hypothetical protein
MKYLTFILLLFLSGFVHAAEKGPNRALVLQNIPVNSDLRCVGLSVIVELLLDAQYSKETIQVDAKPFSDSVYNNLFGKSKLSIPQHIKVNNRLLPIHSKEAIDHLGTLTTNIYKKEYHAACKTQKGKVRVNSQHKFFIKTLQDITTLLKADLDEMEVFIGMGKRTFDDGTVKTTHHAFILGLDDNGDLVVRDPNDPREAWKCKVQKSDTGLTVGWRCLYRDTGHSTSQAYHLISKENYFSKVLTKPEK